MYTVEATTVLHWKVEHRLDDETEKPFETSRTSKKNSTMQLLTTVFLTIAAISLMSSAVKASPILRNVNDDFSMEELKGLADEREHKFKRICGLSIVCRPYSGGKKRRLGTPWKPFSDKSTDVILPPYRQENNQDY